LGVQSFVALRLSRFFRPVGADHSPLIVTHGFAPWAVFFRRFAAAFSAKPFCSLPLADGG